MNMFAKVISILTFIADTYIHLLSESHYYESKRRKIKSTPVNPR
jgi:hypothetical protein